MTCTGEGIEPRFSVLIPVYNAARYIEATLLSIRNQAFESLEVIVMDGGSSDDTGKIVAGFSGLNIVWRSEPDRGQLDAVQKAIGLARGEILYWLNADDVLMPGSLHEVDRAFADDPALDLVFSDDFGFDEERQTLVNGGLIKGLSFEDHALFYRQMCSECVFWRRERTRFLPETDFDLRLCTDYAFFLNLRRGLNVRWLPKRLGAFRIAEGQISKQFGDRLADERKRIKDRSFADVAWAPSSIRWRRIAHAPSFLLRQQLRPAMAAIGRAIARTLDGNARRRKQTCAFYVHWLNARSAPDDTINKLLYR